MQLQRVGQLMWEQQSDDLRHGRMRGAGHRWRSSRPFGSLVPNALLRNARRVPAMCTNRSGSERRAPAERHDICLNDT
jgi:hypothetical protein